MRGFYWGAILGLAIMCVVNSARADDKQELRDFQKQILYLQYTEICSTPMPKGGALPNALSEVVKKDPDTWLPWVGWWNEMVGKYNKCSDA
jgi:hypothetical protein